MRPTPVKTLKVDELAIEIYDTKDTLGAAAAHDAREILQQAIAERGAANVILATGNSQLSFLRVLRQMQDIDWSKVRVFHMDEYIGIDPAHPASFPLYMYRNFVDHVPNLGMFHPIPGQSDKVEQTCQEYDALLRQYSVDLVALGYGENGHLAFNDPPYAKFDDPAWVKVVELAEASRKQQVGEGHFKSLDEVPTHAITLTIPALMAAKKKLCIVPEARKANAVYTCMRGPITEDAPGSILRREPEARLYLDTDSAAKL